MNSSLTKKLLLISSLAILAGSAVALGATYSLWSAAQNVNNHVAAGSLKIELKRTNLVQTKIGGNGLVYDETDATVVDLTEDGSKLFNVEHAFPTWQATSTINIKNVGTVPFDYSVAFTFDYRALTEDKDKALAEQLKVTLLGSDGTTKLSDFKLSEVQSGSFTQVNTLLSGADENFFVAVEFVDSEDNNDAMLGSLSFDLSAKAVQKALRE